MSYNPKVRTVLYSHFPNLHSVFSDKPRLAITFPARSRYTKQEFRDDCNINTIMSRYMKTGELPHINKLAPQYFDAAPGDFQTHMNAVAEAKTLFAQLPSDVRNRFRNDPGQFMDFCSDDSNRVELARMGLLSRDVTRSLLRADPPTEGKPAPPKTAPKAVEPSPKATTAPEEGA